MYDNGRCLPLAVANWLFRSYSREQILISPLAFTFLALRLVKRHVHATKCPFDEPRIAFWTRGLFEAANNALTTAFRCNTSTLERSNPGKVMLNPLSARAAIQGGPRTRVDAVAAPSIV